jgi:hypothetical protein
VIVFLDNFVRLFILFSLLSFLLCFSFYVMITLLLVFVDIAMRI